MPDEKRAAVAQAIRDGGTCRGVAKTFGIAPDTVRRIADEHGITDAFARTGTEAATRAKQADNRARRAQLASDLLGDAIRLREQLWKPTTIGAFGGREGEWHEADVPEPPFADKRAILASVQTAIRSHSELEKVDAGSGAEGAASMLNGIADALSLAANALEPGSEDVDSDPR